MSVDKHVPSGQGQILSPFLYFLSIIYKAFLLQISKLIKMIQSFKLNEEKFIFFDVFWRDNQIFLIVPIYDPSDETRKDKIQIRCDDFILPLNHVHKRIQYEPILVLIYDFPCTSLESIKFEIIFEEITRKNIVLEHSISERKYTLSLTTLFKDDYIILDLFYEYYKKQGVEHFYLYFNGKITDKVREKCQDRSDITLIEWDFLYMNDDKKCTFVHHAQVGQMHHALYRFGKIQNEYMIFCDFDEYMYIDVNNSSKRIIDEIRENPVDVYGFHNFWCKTLDGNIPTTFPEQIEIGVFHSFGDRSKCIYRMNSIDIIRIHEPFLFSIDSPVLLKHSHYRLLHFFYWTNKTRHPKDRNMLQILDIHK
jgi:hypothetical protein